MHNFRDLNIWKRARSLVKEIYGITKDFPPQEAYGLTSQIRRAAISITSNIAEGTGRQSEKELVRFLDISYGSAFELESLLILVADLNYQSEEQIEILLNELHEIQKMIYSFKLTIERKLNVQMNN